MSIHNMPDYDRELRRHRLSRFAAWCLAYSAVFVAGMAIAGMIAEAHSAAFIIAVLIVVIGGAFGARYLATHH